MKATRILLGLDVHAKWIVVVRQVGGLTPQPAQRIRSEEFVKWATRQVGQAQEVWSCYEAGPFGYGLHRELEAVGVHNLVVCPQDWDERRQRVKTDARDGLAIVQRLGRYLGGDTKALAVVRVPSEQEEWLRGQARMREQLLHQRQRLEAQGRSAMLYHGHRDSGRWWHSALWERVRRDLPEPLVPQLELWRQMILETDARVRRATAELQDACSTPLPKGLGSLSWELIRREVCSWARFRNRRQVASYTGLCPSERSSGERRRQGSITKCGNPRLRHVLIESAWRLSRFQPNYWALRRWRGVLRDPRASRSQRKKAIVALARQLAVDLWRMATGRATAEQLGLSFATT